MKLIFSIFLALSVFGAGGAAQSVCRAELTDAPVLFNLKLGISPAAAQSVLGKDLKIKNKRNGEYTFFQNFIERKATGSLANVRALYLRFYEGALYQIEIFYEDEPDAQTLENFINLQTAKFNLPREAWKIKYGIAEINCGAFSLAADKFLNSRVELTDESVRAKVTDARKRN
ncbi:MAG TPA: hypothetical protein VF721_04930 [Pyrinomonadaceae bacterium]|jgi:hypothetical protein